MQGRIAIRRETKSTWERRSPVTPELARRLVKESGLEVLVQPSARRVFRDDEYVRAGARISENLSEASVILGVKEVPPELFQADTAYVFFSHVIKGQPYNMPMLRRMLELGCTLIDYEKICDEVLGINKKIRYAGVYDYGELYDKKRKGLKSYLTREETET